MWIRIQEAQKHVDPVIRIRNVLHRLFLTAMLIIFLDPYCYLLTKCKMFILQKASLVGLAHFLLFHQLQIQSGI
jgi:hypothetical protein